MQHDQWQDEKHSLAHFASSWLSSDDISTCSLFAAMGACDPNNHLIEFGLIDERSMIKALGSLGVPDDARLRLITLIRSIIINGWFSIWCSRLHQQDHVSASDDDEASVADDEETSDSCESDSDSSSSAHSDDIRDDG